MEGRMLCLLAAFGVFAATSALSIPFPCRQRGSFPLPGATCSMYYMVCRSGYGQGTKTSCPRGLFFNSASQRCNPPSQVRGCERFAQAAPLPTLPALPRAPKPVFFPKPAPQPQAPPPPKFQPQQAPIPRPAPPPKFFPQQAPIPRPAPPPKFIPRPASPPVAAPAPAPKPFFQPSPYAPRAPPPPPPPQQAPRGYGSFPSPPQAAPPSGPFDCFGLEDGDYGNGCSNTYYSCSGNIATEKKCSMDALKFDQDSDACLMPEEIKACGGAPKPPTTASPAFPPVVKDPRCEGKPSGIFEMPGQACSSKYLSCNDGFGSEMDCAAGMKFDVVTGMCQGAMYVQACGGVPTPFPTTDAPSTQAPMDPSFVCDGKPDGDYAHPKIQCAYGYYSCVGGVPMPRICPSNELRFDPAQGRCEEQQYNTQCGGAPRQEDPTTTHAPFVPESEFTCAGKEDGLYDDHYGCSATFYACSGGMPSKFKCQGDMAFDLPSKKCQAQEYVKACGGSPTPEPVFDDGPTPLPPPEIQFDCSKGEGPHSLGCSNEWVVCSFGYPYKKTCSSPGLKYDPTIDQCQDSSLISECGGVPTPPPTPAPPAPQPIPVPFDCSLKNDGIYADDKQPCSPHFFTCSAGIAAQIKCPEGLYYDAEEQACKSQTAVPACKSLAPPQPKFTGYAPPPPKFTGYRPAPAPAPIPQASAPLFVPRPKPKTPIIRQFQPAPAPAPKPRFIPRPNPKFQQFQPRPFKPAFNGY